MWWFMQAEEMERVHYFVNSTNSQEQFPTWDAMVLCWAELLHWYNGKFPWWSPSLSDNCTAMIKFPPSENWNSFNYQRVGMRNEESEWEWEIRMGNKNRKWKWNGQFRMDRWEWGRTWAQFWGGCSQRFSRSCSAASCTAPDESGGPQPQGTWGPEGAYGEVGGHLVKFSPSKVLIPPIWLQKCSIFEFILFYLFYLCTNQNLEVGFCFFSLCSSFWYASRIDKVKFSCVLCIK